LRDQNRIIGPQRGADTTAPERRAGSPAVAASSIPPAAAKSPPSSDNPANKHAWTLAQKYNCTGCHGLDRKLVGPAFKDIASKHAGKADYLAGKIKAGGAGVWGSLPMPPQSLPEADARLIATWLATGAGK
jgi:cytochrome c551/c552